MSASGGKSSWSNEACLTWNRFKNLSAKRAKKTEKLLTRWKFSLGLIQLRSIQISCIAFWRKDCSERQSNSSNFSDRKAWPIWTKSRSSSRPRNSKIRVRATIMKRIMAQYRAETLAQRPIKSSRWKTHSVSCATKRPLSVPFQPQPLEAGSAANRGARLPRAAVIWSRMSVGSASTRRRSSSVSITTWSRRATARCAARFSLRWARTEKLAISSWRPSSTRIRIYRRRRVARYQPYTVLWSVRTSLVPSEIW